MGVRTGTSLTRATEAEPIVQVDAAGTVQVSTSPARGFIAVPASGGTALTTPTRGLVVTTAGNLGVLMADGTDNNTQLVAVTAGQILQLQVVKHTALNTAVVLGLT
jgi:hypothetical protein